VNRAEIRDISVKCTIEKSTNRHMVSLSSL
jgi:hypothetical protein